jgi:hypothetical protein
MSSADGFWPLAPFTCFFFVRMQKIILVGWLKPSHVTNDIGTKEMLQKSKLHILNDLL